MAHMTPSNVVRRTSETAGTSTNAVSVEVLALPEHCYRCGVLTYSIVGFLAPSHLTERPDGFIDFETLAALLVRRVSADQLARCGVGPIRMRRSRYRPEGYLSNGCIGCDAIQGSFPLHEDLMEFLSEGGRYEELIVGRWHLREVELSRRIPRTLV
jgi:hypothetical protein